MLYNSFSEEIFPNIQSEPPLVQLGANSPCSDCTFHYFLLLSESFRQMLYCQGQTVILLNLLAELLQLQSSGQKLHWLRVSSTE